MTSTLVLRNIAATLVLWATLVPPVPLSAADQGRGISPEEARTYIRDTPDVFILDVRTRREFAVQHVTNAYNIPIKDLPQRVHEIPSGRPVLVYCNIGGRSPLACDIIRAARPDITTLVFITGWAYMNE